jgi:hypothetical protein
VNSSTSLGTALAGGGPEWLFPNPQQQLQELWTLRMEPPL